MKLLHDINDRLNDMAQECEWPRFWKLTVIICTIGLTLLYLNFKR